MAKILDLLDSKNQKFDPGASGMSSTNAQDGIIEAYSIVNVQFDLTPTLGGDLQTNNNDIIIQDGSANEKGRLKYISAENAVALAFISDPGAGLDPKTDGGILAKAGELTLAGSITEVINLSGSGTQQVYVSDDGVLYGVEPPVAGWTETDVDNADYTFPTLGTWVEIVGLVITIPQPVDVGDRVDAFINLYIQNGSSNTGGSIDIGIGIDNVAPTTALNNISIEGGFDAVVPTSITTTLHGGLAIGQTLSVFVRRSTQDNAQFNPQLLGSIDPSELIVSVPTAGGGGGGNTDLGNIPAPTTVTITSSTGANTVLAGAVSGTAGVMTGAQVDSLNAKADQTALDSHTGDTVIHMDADQGAAMDAANSPSAANAIATINDLLDNPSGGTALQYVWSTDTTATDPGSGRVKANNADLSLATEIYVSNLTKAGNNVQPAWSAWRNGDYLGIADSKQASNGRPYRLTANSIDNTGWFTLQVTALGSTQNPAIGNNRDTLLNLIADPASRIPQGGTAGQRLTKIDGVDYNTEWADPGVTEAGDNVFTGNNAFLGDFNVGNPGIETGSIQVDGVSYPSVGKFNRFGAGVTAEVVIHRHSTTDGSNLVFSRALSNDVTHANVVDGTVLGDIQFTGWGDSSYWTGAVIRAVVDGNPGVSDMPTKLDFLTSADGGFTPALRMSLRANGTVELGNATVIGDASVAGLSSNNFLEVVKYAYYNTKVLAAAATVNFADGGRQEINAITYPNILLTPGIAAKPANYILTILNSNNLVSIAPSAGGAIEWGGGTPPVWAGKTVLTFYYDGTVWIGSKLVGVA